MGRGLILWVTLISPRIVPDRRLTSFLKESIEVRLFWSSVSIKLDGLRMLEVRRPIANFLWYWESYLMRLQLVYMEVFESPKLFQEKPWTQPKARDF